MNSALLDRQEQLAREYMQASDPKGRCTYHNWEHVQNVFSAAKTMLGMIELPVEEKENILLAAIWHDADYANGYKDHEKRSALLALSALQDEGLSEERLAQIKRLIEVTDMSGAPQRIDEKILRDADLSHLAGDNYFDSYFGLYAELKEFKGLTLSEAEWLDECISFMTEMNYYSEIGGELFNEGKEENLKRLMSMSAQNELPKPQKRELTKEEKKALKKKRKKNRPKFNTEKGIETMFRVTLRNHINLSRIADDKANTLISVNAIILSIVLSALFPKLDSNPFLIYPGFSLLLVSIITIILSTLSTIPKTTHGSVSRTDVEQKKGNLLFFGNFHSMSLADYEWGITELMKDGEYLYSSLTRDLYFLGRVLERKYSLLRYAYLTFVFGLVLSIILFVWSILSLAPEVPLLPE